MVINELFPFFSAVHESGIAAVDGSSTGTRVPKMWALIGLPRFGGATHANGFDDWSRHRKIYVDAAQPATLNNGAGIFDRLPHIARGCVGLAPVAA